MPRMYIAIASVASLAVLLWFVPLVHIVPLDRANGAAAGEGFDAARYAQQLWTDSLPNLFDTADEAETVITALIDAPETVKERFGRTQGVGRGYYLFLKGTGTVADVSKKGVTVTLVGEAKHQVLLTTGFIFGSTIRDATGVFTSSDVATTQQFNDVSDLLNRQAESKVLTPLSETAEVGQEITFVACAQIKDPARVSQPIAAIPILTHRNE